MAHGDAREGKWRGNWRMEWVASTLHTTSEHGVSSVTTANAHTSAASSRLIWRLRRFKWTRPFRRKTKCVFCACAITFQTQSTSRVPHTCQMLWQSHSSWLFTRIIFGEQYRSWKNVRLENACFKKYVGIYVFTLLAQDGEREDERHIHAVLNIKENAWQWTVTAPPRNLINWHQMVPSDLNFNMPKHTVRQERRANEKDLHHISAQILVLLTFCVTTQIHVI